MGNDETVLALTLEELIAVQHNITQRNEYYPDWLQEQVGRGMLTLSREDDGITWGIRMDKQDARQLLKQIPILYIQGGEPVGFRINRKIFALLYGDIEADAVINEAWEKSE